MARNVTVPEEELRRLQEVASEARALLRAMQDEAAPAADLSDSIITQHHIDRLSELAGPL